jgi:uncharacterized protein (DUF2384 family)
MTFAEQISETLVVELKEHMILANELAMCDEEVAAAALDSFHTRLSSGYWLTKVHPSLGSDKTPMELSRTREGKAAVLLALGQLSHGVFP